MTNPEYPGTLAEFGTDRSSDKPPWLNGFLNHSSPKEFLQKCMGNGVFTHFPSLQQLDETPQDEKWHPEGSVWQHTLLVVDEVFKLAQAERLSKEAAEILLVAALLHDIGKPVTLQRRDGHIYFPNHAQEGERLAKDILDKIGIQGREQTAILNLIVNHINLSELYRKHRKGLVVQEDIVRFITRLLPASPIQLAILVRADHLGRAKDRSQILTPEVDWFLQEVEELGFWWRRRELNPSPKRHDCTLLQA